MDVECQLLFFLKTHPWRHAARLEEAQAFNRYADGPLLGTAPNPDSLLRAFMNRDDWTVVGLRLFGVWMMVEVLLNAAEVLRAVLNGDTGLVGWAMIGLVFKLLIGAGLAFRSERIAARLGRASAKQAPSAPG